MVDLEKVEKLTDGLLIWFSEHGRTFPWRENLDQYRALLAEILLQQTFAAKVVPVYIQLIGKYPSFVALAKANEGDVREIIQPLGLLYRAELLISVSNEIVSKYSGKLPCEKGELLKIHGVGNYIADAVLTHVFGVKVIPIDTNINRIICRIFGLDYPVKTVATKRKVLELTSTMAEHLQETKNIHYAMLDFAADVCKFYNPAHSRCPFRHFCMFYKSASQV